MAKLKILSTFKTKNSEDTIKKAFEFSEKLVGGEMILLSGEIGSGKTTFLNGVLKALGSRKKVISSSFSLMSFYKARKFNLIHFDFYRIEGRFSIMEVIEYLSQDNIVAIEWPYDIKKYSLFKPYLIDIKMLKGDNRFVKISKYE